MRASAGCEYRPWCKTRAACELTGMTALGPEAGVHSLPRLLDAGVTGSDRNVTPFVMALLSFKELTPGAYRLKASNAALPISTSGGVSPTADGSARLAVDGRQRNA